LVETQLPFIKYFSQFKPRWRQGRRIRCRQFLRWRLAALVGLMLCAMAAPLLAAEAAEYKVKAAFLYNLARFVEWPKEAMGAQAAQFQLCVYGQDPFNGALTPIESKKIAGKKVVVRRLAPTESLAGCHMVFVSTSQQNELGPLISKLSDKPILTVGDTPGYAKDGVIVNFYLEQRKVRFEINVRAAKSAGLRVSSKLLALARII
jgi:hypothetical protein